MKTFKEMLRSNYKDLIFILMGLILPFLLFRSLFYCIIAAIISLGLAILFKYLTFKEENKNSKKLACYAFLSDFLLGLKRNEGSSQSYSRAVKYLIGYEEVKDYQSLLDGQNSLYHLGEYNQFFNYVLQKDKENEIHLLNFQKTIFSLDNKIDKYEKESKDYQKEENSVKIAILIFYLLFALILGIFPTLRDVLNNIYYKLFGSLIISLIIPSIYLSSYLRERSR